MLYSLCTVQRFLALAQCGGSVHCGEGRFQHSNMLSSWGGGWGLGSGFWDHGVCGSFIRSFVRAYGDRWMALRRYRCVDIVLCVSVILVLKASARFEALGLVAGEVFALSLRCSSCGWWGICWGRGRVRKG